MIIELKNKVFPRIMKMIVEDSISNGVSVLMFVSFDCDSICGCKILSKIFEHQMVAHQIICVRNLSEIAQNFKAEMEATPTTKSVIMFNCGGNFDLFELLSLEEYQNVILYVLDTHRPYHSANVNNKQQILLLDGGFNDSSSTEGVTYHGYSTACLSYVIASQIGLRNNDMLWYAILGLTDQYLHMRIDSLRYKDDYYNIKNEVLDHIPQSSSDNNDLKLHDSSITLCDDFKFFLYRHWSLYNGMKFSNYIAIKLQMWESKGENRLDELLAKMGIPKSECVEKYSSMKKEFKELFPTKLENYAQQFGIDHINYQGFLKKFKGMDKGLTEVSALDVVYVISTLLEKTKLSSSTSSSTEASALYPDDFWCAYDALDIEKHQKLFDEGITKAQKLQESILNQVTSMIQRREVVSSPGFNFAFIKDASNQKLFITPLTLQKLAFFLDDSITELQKKKVKKPLILGALNEFTDNYIVVGVPGHLVSANDISYAFKRAPENTGARMKLDHFDTTMIEIHKTDLERFIDFLKAEIGF